MADFNPAFDRTIQNEGGYRLIDVASDRGGQTYAGIARNFHPDWPGWTYIDQNNLQDLKLSTLVRSFYKQQFWDKVGGDQINSQIIAESIFDFAVNAGVSTAAKITQIAIGAVPDGRIGPVSLEKLNALDEAAFVLHFTVGKLKRYADICNRDRSQNKFLLGWLNRTLKGLV